MKILALDLGKFNSVSCFYNTQTQTTEFGPVQSIGGLLSLRHARLGLLNLRPMR